MLRFTPNVQISYFNRRLSDILEYASVWSLRAHADVWITAIDDRQRDSGALHGESLAIDLSVQGNEAEPLARLHGFLARYLPSEYDVVLGPDRVHVAYTGPRRPAPRHPRTGGPEGDGG